MSDADNQGTATIETKAEFAKSPSDFTRNWMTAIEAAGKEEDNWRTEAESTIARYRKTKVRQFNVLYANTQTTIPALYNSEPTPDVRRRFGETDPDGKQVSMAIERALSIQCELYDFDGCMKAAVKDRQLAGRGVTRVRVVTGETKHIECEAVQWDDYRRGPAKTRKDLPWEAFRHRLTREELVELNPEVGPKIKLDAVIDGIPKKDNTDRLPDIFKRAIVWEVWDRTERKVYFFAESYPDGPVKTIDDPYRLRGFFCTPDPLYAVQTTDTLVPVCEFTLWKPLADEVDELTARIISIVKVIKWRGLYDGAFARLVEKLTALNDGELAAADDSGRSMAQGGIDKAIWMMPVEQAATVVQTLYEAREQAKNNLYEMTGVADILRGSTQASETATAQQIKAQWGSLRLQEAQRDVQRYARDLFRLMADLMAEHMEPAEISGMTGIQFSPQQVALLKAPDLQREFVVEIETDSTIRADLTRAQEQAAGFVTGLSSLMEPLGMAVQAQMMSPTVAIKIIGGLASNFKLGRQVAMAMDEWQKEVEEKAKQPPQPPPPDPKAETEKIKAAAAVQKTQMDAQANQQKHAQQMEKIQADGQLAQLKAGLQMQGLQAEVQMKGAELAMQGQEMQMQERQMAQSAQVAEQGHAMKMEQQQAKQQQAQKVQPGEVNYSKGMGNTVCANCKHYQGGKCALVEGVIRPDYWCELYEAKEATQ